MGLDSGNQLEKLDGIREKIKSLCDENYTFEQALILCRMNHYIDGLLYLYEEAQLYDLILDHYIDTHDVPMIMETCERFSDKEERLWVKAFLFLAKSPEIGTNELKRVLEEVDQRNLMPATGVIDVLSSSADIKVVKDYLVQWFTKTMATVTKNSELISQYQETTEKMKDEIESIRSQPKVFQSIRCSSCKVLLELPSIHFLCGHSYHQGCLESPEESDRDQGCPLCIPDQIRSIASMSS